MQQDKKDSQPIGKSDSSILSQPADGTERFTSLYSSIFSPRPSFPTSVSASPSDCSVDDDGTASFNSPLIVDNLQFLDLAYSPHARLILEHQDLVDRYTLCLAHLHETSKEAEELRRENANLRIANRDLSKRLGLLIQASLQPRVVPPPDYSSLTVADGFRGLSIGEKASGSTSTTTRACSSRAWDEANDESPTSVIESNRIEGLDLERVALPKSISVRSSGYLKTTQAASSTNGGGNRNPVRPRTASPSPPVSGTKVYVHGGTQEQSPVEMEVYNQGMFKTELCNKWQETGSCPYGEHCQFAHGIKELRPVIRHPRYKTEVCRMVLAGDNCPYGHRCHFRHALTEEEKLMAAPNLRRRAEHTQ